MTMTDPIGDMLTRIRNAIRNKRHTVRIPKSKIKVGIAKHEEGAERAFAVQPIEHRRVAAHASSACAWATSLSPRPDNPTTIALSGSCWASLSA